MYLSRAQTDAMPDDQLDQVSFVDTAEWHSLRRAAGRSKVRLHCRECGRRATVWGVGGDLSLPLTGVAVMSVTLTEITWLVSHCGIEWPVEPSRVRALAAAGHRRLVLGTDL